MNPEQYLVSSPLFFFHRPIGETRAEDLCSGQRFKRLSKEACEIFHFFLTKKPASVGITHGFSAERLGEAVDAGILLSVDDPQYVSANLWESRNWSRAAFLLYSQQDLVYVEPTDAGLELEELSALRRQEIRGYIDEQAYPERRLIDSSLLVPLPDGPAIPPSLDAMVARRSVRAFASDAVTLDAFSRVLKTSTERVRIADASKATGDPYYLLNSFYTWLEIYVVVQRVDGLERGAYQYQSDKHELRMGGGLKSDRQIATCIQNQEWIGGGGFCVFVVVDWKRYMWLYRHSRAYINLLIQMGEYAQEVLQASYTIGLGGWMTPAVNESVAGSLLGLDGDREDAMYFIKIGLPASSGE